MKAPPTGSRSCISTGRRKTSAWQSGDVRVFESSAIQGTVRQRFGDANQAIFDHEDDDEAAQTDPFPDLDVMREIPDSYRFGEGIAKLAAPLGVQPQPLCGRGPKEVLASGRTEADHTVFVFEEGEQAAVLGAFARLLAETFSEQELRTGSFLAVGLKHSQSGSEDPAKEPQRVGHYWDGYRPEIALREPRPPTMRQHILIGTARSAESGESHPGINMVTAGIARLVTLQEGAAPAQGFHTHQQVMRGLNGTKCSRPYQYLLCRWIGRGQTPSRKMWEKVWSGVLRKVVGVLTGREARGKGFSDFLAWSNNGPGAAQTAQNRTTGDNIFRYPSEDPKVAVRLGSIHSVKGETHTAVLLLETFWYKHNLGGLLPWLDGSKSGAGKPRDSTRLKIHYVGMTRPTHLVCLALRRDSLLKPNGDVNDELIARLKVQGWRVEMIHRVPGDVAR